jgi:hypothetical protein
MTLIEFAQTKVACSKALIEKATKFLADNPNPTDEKVHAWASKQGVEKDEVEEAIYSLASKYSKFAKGGNSNKPDAPKKFDSKQIKAGVEVEKEHTPDIEDRKKISKDHLSEKGMSKYYNALKAMEDRLKKNAAKGQTKTAGVMSKLLKKPWQKTVRVMKGVGTVGKMPTSIGGTPVA